MSVFNMIGVLIVATVAVIAAVFAVPHLNPIIKNFFNGKVQSNEKREGVTPSVVKVKSLSEIDNEETGFDKGDNFVSKEKLIEATKQFQMNDDNKLDAEEWAKIPLETRREIGNHIMYARLSRDCYIADENGLTIGMDYDKIGLPYLPLPEDLPNNINQDHIKGRKGVYFGPTFRKL